LSSATYPRVRWPQTSLRLGNTTPTGGTLYTLGAGSFAIDPSGRIGYLKAASLAAAFAEGFTSTGGRIVAFPTDGSLPTDWLNTDTHMWTNSTGSRLGLVISRDGLYVDFTLAGSNPSVSAGTVSAWLFLDG
jgi:hypothetical protein